MRSHAKASSTGPIAHRTKGLCISVAFLVLLGTFAAMAPSAGAKKIYAFKEAFGSAAQPTFVRDTAMAVDQSNGDLLVIDSEADTLSRFKPDGTPHDFSALGTNVIDGKGTGDETPENGLAFDGPAEVQVAVDNSSGATAGNIYVTGASQGVIDIFNSAGTYIGQLTATDSEPLGKPCGVAVDSSGTVYVGDYSSGIHKYVPAASPPVDADHVATLELVQPCAVAAGAGPTAGFIFAVKFGGKVSKLDSTNGELQYEINEFPTTISVDPDTGFLYAVGGTFGAEYDASSALEASFVSGFTSSGAIEGIAVRSSGNAYLSREGSSNVQEYSRIPIPDVVTGTVSNRTKTSVTLNGTVDPEGEVLEECKFEYGPSEAYGQTVPCAENVATIGSGDDPVPVHADISGLSTTSSYHFRLVAKNKNSTQPIKGNDSSFLTLGVVISGTAATVSDTSAKLMAQLNPNGEATTYHFEFGDQGSCSSNPCTSVPVPDADAGSGAGAIPVSEAISGLTPLTTYHFRLVATNPSSPPGGDVGPDVSFTTYPTPPDFDSCPNEAFRTGPGANLPDCRAYEQASPVNKNGADVNAEVDLLRASTAGDAITFYSNGGLPGGVGSQDFPIFMARRVGGEWVTKGLLPPVSFGRDATMESWTPDLAYTFSKPIRLEGDDFESASASAFVVRNSSDDSYDVITPYKGDPGKDRLAGVSTDGTKVFFQSGRKLTPDAAAGETQNFYAWDRETGTISLVGLIPAGPDTECGAGGLACVTPVDGSLAGPYDWWSETNEDTLHDSKDFYLQEMHVVSASGEKAYFTAGGTGQIYLRENATSANATTAHVSVSQRAVPDPNGAKPAILHAATPDGKRAFFTSCEKLTDDSTAVSSAANRCDTASQGQDLYVYDTVTGELTDLTVDDFANPFGAAVKGVVGIDDDGESVYFVANGDLDGSGPATLGNCAGKFGGTGTCNLYLARDGTITFIAGLSGDADTGAASNFKPKSFSDASNNTGAKGGRVSADGDVVIYQDKDALYRYDAVDDEIVCVSCNPTTGLSTSVRLLSLGRLGFVGPFTRVPAIPRNLSTDGNRVFFDTTAKLVANDINGDAGCPLVGAINGGGGSVFPACQDVYEWEAEGSGSCETSGGCLYLLSTGTSSFPSFFGDASASGDVAFIFTRDQLLPQDEDVLQDAYAVTVGGGLASQNEVPPPGCNGEECRGTGSSAPSSTGASTAVFQGLGNRRSNPPRRCPRGKRKVRAKGRTRCVAKSRRGQRKQNRNANTTRRTSR